MFGSKEASEDKLKKMEKIYGREQKRSESP